MAILDKIYQKGCRQNTLIGGLKLEKKSIEGCQLKWPMV